ncbi:hypothetical protein CDL12_25096 [Handroanthus impetiginosus]|uniref:WAT1-related protein n=1 Tax=Handroanthus impetiginosus TaxID=429701 RepID=A0A2G9GAP9_9LAMI|nr:hypothetical protein CDL12_25096 [Handroanthus impetiginosus]
MIGWDSMKWEVIEDVGVVVGLVCVQFLYAGNSILLSYLLKLGFEASSLIIFSNFATFFVLSPLSVIFERRRWPNRISCRLFVNLLLLSFGGVTVFQSLFMEGVHLTSPAMATAMPNLAPGLIFLIAWAFRLEKIQLGCRYSRAKIGGTFLCVFGAVVMSLMQSSTVQDNTEKEAFLSPSSDIAFDKQIIVGSMYLIAAVFVLSIQVVLQAITLREFPAPMSLCATTSLIGMLITTVLQFIEDHTWDPGWPQLSIQEMISYSILAGSVSGMCVSFNAWAMKKKGPVMVSIFNPLGTVISALFSVITFGEFIGLGSLAGMCLMFIGLYSVLWAKKHEDFAVSLENEYDVEKPLLS